MGWCAQRRAGRAQSAAACQGWGRGFESRSNFSQRFKYLGPGRNGGDRIRPWSASPYGTLRNCRLLEVVEIGILRRDVPQNVLVDEGDRIRNRTAHLLKLRCTAISFGGLQQLRQIGNRPERQISDLSGKFLCQFSLPMHSRSLHLPEGSASARGRG